MRRRSLRSLRLRRWLLRELNEIRKWAHGVLETDGFESDVQSADVQISTEFPEFELLPYLPADHPDLELPLKTARAAWGREWCSLSNPLREDERDAVESIASFADKWLRILDQKPELEYGTLVLMKNAIRFAYIYGFIARRREYRYMIGTYGETPEEHLAAEIRQRKTGRDSRRGRTKVDDDELIAAIRFKHAANRWRSWTDTTEAVARDYGMTGRAVRARQRVRDLCGELFGK
jgi:hypothetical protein